MNLAIEFAFRFGKWRDFENVGSRIQYTSISAANDAAYSCCIKWSDCRRDAREAVPLKSWLAWFDSEYRNLANILKVKSKSRQVSTSCETNDVYVSCAYQRGMNV